MHYLIAPLPLRVAGDPLTHLPETDQAQRCDAEHSHTQNTCQTRRALIHVEEAVAPRLVVPVAEAVGCPHRAHVVAPGIVARPVPVARPGSAREGASGCRPGEQREREPAAEGETGRRIRRGVRWTGGPGALRRDERAVRALVVGSAADPTTRSGTARGRAQSSKRNGRPAR